MSEEDGERVRDIIKAWAAAVEAGDRQGILSHHAGDVLMFDFPSTVRGLDAYAATWDAFYADPPGPIVFRPGEIAVTAGRDVAFGFCEIHCDGTCAGPLDFRLTVGLTKEDGDWLITHEHHSVPTVEERFIVDEEG